MNNFNEILKQIIKRDFKNYNDLFALNKEICLMYPNSLCSILTSKNSSEIEGTVFGNDKIDWFFKLKKELNGLKIISIEKQ